MRWPQWFVLVVVVVLGIAGWKALGADRFVPLDHNLDFSHETDVGILGSDWEIVPVPKWRGVVQVFDRGRPAAVPLELPFIQQAYQLRLKVTFLDPRAGLSYAMNGTPLGEWLASKVGQAEKRSFFLPAELVRAGRNEVTFTSHGPARAVLYEQVRVRNFQSKIWKPHLYLIPKGAGTPPRIQPIWVLGVVAGGLVVWGLSAWGWAALGRWPWPCTIVWGTWAWVVAGLGVAIAMAVPHVTPYRLVATPTGYGVFLAILWGAGQIPIAVVAVLRRMKFLLFGAYRLFWHLGGTPKLRTVLWALVLALSQLLWWMLRQVGQGIVVAVRWFFANQHPAGYLKMAGGLLVISLLCDGFKWKLVAINLGHAAGIALVIAVVLQALRSLREEDDLPAR